MTHLPQNCIDMLAKDGKSLGFGIKKLVNSLLYTDHGKPFDIETTDRKVSQTMILKILKDFLSYKNFVQVSSSYSHYPFDY